MIKIPTAKTKLILFGDIIFCLIIIALFIGSIFFINSLRNEVAVKKVELVQAEEQNAKLEGINQTLQTRQAEISLLENYFVAKDNTIEFLSWLEDEAKKSGLDLKINITSELVPLEKEALQLATLSLRVNTNGGFSETMEFYRQISLQAKLVSLSNLRLGSDRSLGSVRSQDTTPLASPANQWSSSADIQIYQKI